jgi:hypothetical protein
LFSCDDGNFEVPSFEFNEVVNTCGNYVLYRTNSNQTEAFIIQLTETDIEQTEGTKTIAITPTNCNYRIFDSEVNADYFCSDVPPITPVVIRIWEADAGTNNKITIDTIAIFDTDDSTIISYEHKLTLTNLVLVSEGEQIIYETYNFGSFKTLPLTL